MSLLPKSFADAMFVLNCIATAVYLIANWRMFSILRRDHPATFEELGKPALFGRGSPGSGLKSVKFVLRRTYRSFSDSSLSKSGNLVLVALFVDAISVLLWVAVSLTPGA